MKNLRFAQMPFILSYLNWMPFNDDVVYLTETILFVRKILAIVEIVATQCCHDAGAVMTLEPVGLVARL